jgi:hypothetical protein
VACRFDTWSACWRSIAGFSRAAFLADACTVFRAVNEARASRVAARLDAVKQV